MRNLITSTAEDLGPTGYDYETGYGVVNPCAIIPKVTEPEEPVIDICRRFPWICSSRWWKILCRRFPWICDPRWWRRVLNQAPADAFAAGPGDPEALFEFLGQLASEDEDTSAQAAYRLGYAHGRRDALAGTEADLDWELLERDG